MDLTVVKDQDTDRYILDYLKVNHGEAGIIYASTRKEVMRLTSLLQKHDIKATPYHAGLDDAVRVLVLDHRQIQVIAGKTSIHFMLWIDR
ncbi:hypothetical protein WP50_36235 [Lactiplantibacillus plantarum]|nr:hypothetical protein WP50_36235 [Lactiplantibacillus plantarum]